MQESHLMFRPLSCFPKMSVYVDFDPNLSESPPLYLSPYKKTNKNNKKALKSIAVVASFQGTHCHTGSLLETALTHPVTETQTKPYNDDISQKEKALRHCKGQKHIFMEYTV